MTKSRLLKRKLEKSREEMVGSKSWQGGGIGRKKVAEGNVAEDDDNMQERGMVTREIETGAKIEERGRGR